MEKKLIEFKVEQNNHVLATIMNMYKSSDQKDWDSILEFAKFVTYTTVTESMGFAPFSLIYGREARLPMDLEFGVSADLIISDGDSSLPHAERIKKYLQRAYCILRVADSSRKAKKTL